MSYSSLETLDEFSEAHFILYVSTYTQAPLFKLSQIKIFNDAQVRLAKYHWACDWKVSLQNTLDNELENGVQI